VGCEYWAADLGNFFAEADDDELDFALVVANANETLTAQVSVSTELGELESRSVAPGTLTTFLAAEGRPRHKHGSTPHRLPHREQRARGRLPVQPPRDRDLRG
jgi:hypothetical protein